MNTFEKIDSMFQRRKNPPKQHYIIEAHPDVLAHMRELGWYERRGVTILEGKWQDFVESEELLSVGGFDVIYTDTFSEDYQGKILNLNRADQGGGSLISIFDIINSLA